MLKILFLCTGNACRSQMAEGWAKALKSDALEAYSAGITPHGLDARAVAVMAEAGVDIAAHRSKDIAALADIAFDVVVTVCDRAAETCPIFPGNVRTLHRGFEDPPAQAAGLPKEEALNAYRRVRDDIRAFVETLPDSILVTLEEPS